MMQQYSISQNKQNWWRQQMVTHDAFNVVYIIKQTKKVTGQRYNNKRLDSLFQKSIVRGHCSSIEKWEFYFNLLSGNGNWDGWRITVKQPLQWLFKFKTVNNDWQTIWKPPESVSSALGQFINLWRPPISSMSSEVGRRAKW